MFKDCEYRMLIERKARSILIKLWLVLTALAKVAVLLILIVCPGPMRADNVNGISLRLFEFTSEFYMPMSRGIFKGLMACGGSQYRIAIYWIEPAVYHDNTFFLGYSDFIFKGDMVHYWINGVSQPGTFNLSGKESNTLLPGDVSVESVARSALAIASRIRSEHRNDNNSLELGRFFRQSRDKAEYSYDVPSEPTSNDQASVSRASDVQILNALPYGRKYSKQTRNDGALIWRAQRVLDGRPVAMATIKPVLSTEKDDVVSVFDPETLGRWILIPQIYRAYWSFDRAYTILKDSPDDAVAGRELYDKIEAYSKNNKVPPNVCLFFNQLWFKTAILTDDTNRISCSAQAVVARLCEDDSISDYQGLFELARVANQTRQQFPQQADELVRPLIGQMVRHTGSDPTRSLERLISTIDRNKWFWYGKLLLEEVRNQALVEEDVADTLSARLEAARLAKELPPSGPCEPTATVKQYLAQLDADPPAGTLTLDDIRDILEQGLAKPCADASLEIKHELVEDVVRSIRMIAGEGPFRGDRAKLIESIKQFSGLYLVVFKYKEPIETVLATFLALSFCDISTPEDHDVLFSQIRKICTEFRSLTNNMLTERGLSELVTPNDVEFVFDMYERIFRRYIDNPLWPAFKFPLTSNEQTRLTNKLKLRFMQLEPLFDEMSLKVRYGGEDKKLKEETVYKISLVAQQLLPQSAFLRRPSYPGISCRYRGKYGFAAVIKGPFYTEGERPKEKFKAMKYFHMGHRLEDIVKRERELSSFQ